MLVRRCFALSRTASWTTRPPERASPPMPARHPRWRGLKRPCRAAHGERGQPKPPPLYETSFSLPLSLSYVSRVAILRRGAYQTPCLLCLIDEGNQKET